MNDLFLVGLNYFLNIFFLFSSLWLGLYILLHNPKRQVSWLISITLWSLSGYFLNNLTFLHPRPETGSVPWWWGWSVAIAAPFWFHLSVTLLPGEKARKQRTLVVLFYLLALNIIAMEAYTPWVYQGPGGSSPIYYDFQVPGPLFPIYGLYLVLLPALALWNFRTGWVDSVNPLQRNQYSLFQVASLLAMVGGINAVLSIWLSLATPTLITVLFLGSGVLLLAYGVVRWDALVEGHVRRRDFLYSAAANGVVVLAYLLVAAISNLAFNVPFVAFIFLVCFALITHALYDFGQGILDRYFSSRRKHRELRTNLRDLARSSNLEQDLHENLQALLLTLCSALGIHKGCITCRENGGVSIAAAYGMEADEIHKLPFKEIEHEIELIAGSENQEGGKTLIVPMHHAGIHLGEVVLISPSGVQAFKEDDLELIEDFADRVADVVHTASLQGESLRQLEARASEIRRQEREIDIQLRRAFKWSALTPGLTGWEEAEFKELVEDALRNINDYSYLGLHQFSRLEIVSSLIDCDAHDRVTHLDRGKAVHRLLETCIKKLKPPGNEPEPPTREWHQYAILQRCYLEGNLTRDVMGLLYISEATFHRTRRRAVKGVARAILEMEREFRGHLPSSN